MTDRPTADAAPAAGAPHRSRGRRLGAVVLPAIAGAALAAVAAGMQWWSAEYLDALTGPITVTLSGAACVPELIPLALVGLAGLGAALATAGPLRRLVGIVLFAAGATIAVRSAVALGAAPAGLAGSLTRPAELVGEAGLSPAGPVLATTGGLLMAVAGVLVIAGVGARPLGSKYKRTQRSGDRRPDARPAGAAADPADWWKALDAGADPTEAPAARDGAGGAGGEPAVVTRTGPDGVADTGSDDTASGPPVTTGTHSVNRADGGTRTAGPSARAGADGGAGSTGTVSEQTSRDGYHDPNAPPDLTGGAAGRGA
ncbi:Trp biosynthesis-associated membrane protein [Nakamurella sp. GG22]